MSSASGKSTRRIASALAVVGCGVLIATAGFASASSASSTPRCATANLRLDKVGENDFTSHRGWAFAFRNVGHTTCFLKGYPGPRLLGAQAQPMPTIVGHFGGPPHRVVLHPWHRAFFAITFAVSGPCPAAVFAYGMKIVPPGPAARLVWYAGRFDLCGPGPARLNVSPVAFPRQF